MTKYDYQKMRAEVDLWQSSETDDLDRWEEAQWKEYDADPKGRYFDTIGDGAGFRFREIENKQEELLGLILLAEKAENSGKPNRAEELIAELYSKLGHSGPPPVRGGAEEVDSGDSGSEPEPPEAADISPGKNETGQNIYAALRGAVNRWEEAEYREIDRWEAEQEKEYDKNPEGRYSDTVADGVGVRYTSAQSKAEAMRSRIGQAQDRERHGDVEQADKLIVEIRDELGVADGASETIESFLADRPPERLSLWAKIVFALIVFTVGGAIVRPMVMYFFGGAPD